MDSCDTVRKSQRRFCTKERYSQKWEFSEENMNIRVIQLMLLTFVRLSTKSGTKGTQRN